MHGLKKASNLKTQSHSIAVVALLMVERTPLYEVTKTNSRFIRVYTLLALAESKDSGDSGSNGYKA